MSEEKVYTQDEAREMAARIERARGFAEKIVAAEFKYAPGLKRLGLAGGSYEAIAAAIRIRSHLDGIAERAATEEIYDTWNRLARTIDGRPELDEELRALLDEAS